MDGYMRTPINALMLFPYQKVESLAAVKKTEADE